MTSFGDLFLFWVTIKGNWHIIHAVCNIHILRGFQVASELSADVCHPVTHTDSGCSHCPMCHPFPGGETQQKEEIVLLLPPLGPSLSSRLIKHIPTDYAQGDIHNRVTHTQLHTGRTLPTSDV